MNSRLDELQAAILRVKLSKLDDWNLYRKNLADYYLKHLSQKNIKLPFAPHWADSVWHLFVIRSHYRDKLQNYLKTAGIETMIHYPVPPHLQPVYAGHKWTTESFPLAETVHREVLSLPIGPTLQEIQIQKICEILNHYEEIL